MTPERPAHPAPSEALTERPTWPVPAIARALAGEVSTVVDVAFGPGQAVPLPAGGTLELYPEAGVVRLTGAAARLELFRQEPPRIEHQRGAVLFAHETAEQSQALAITAAGDITLWLSPTQPVPPQDQGQEQEPQTEANVAPAPLQRPETARSASQDPELPPGVQTPLLGHSGGADAGVFVPSRPVSEEPSENVMDMSPVPPRKAEKQPRLSLLGRIGTEPRFRRLPSGTLMVSFRLAVHDQAGHTTWRTIRAFGERAEKLQENLAKGDLVEVIGYLHEQRKETGDGQTKVVPEVYAAVVKSAKKPGESAS